MRRNSWLSELAYRLIMGATRNPCARRRTRGRSIASRLEIIERRQLLSAVGSEFRVNTFTAGDENFPKVAMDASGGYAVVWEGDNTGQDGDSSGIFGQIYTAQGATVGHEFQVNTYTTGGQFLPAIGMNSIGDFVVVWGSNQDGSGTGIYAQRYDGSSKAGTELRVNTYTTDFQDFPAVAMNASGQFVVAWVSNGQDGDGYGIFAQRFDSSGLPVGSEFKVNTYTTGKQHLPAVAIDSAGDFVISWQSYAQDGNNYGVYAQRYDSSGVAQGGEFQVNAYTTSRQESPSVAMDALGNFVITWGSVGQDGDSFGVYARRYNKSGASLGPEFLVNTYTTSIQSVPIVAMDPSGEFVITWNGLYQDGSSTGVFAQQFTAAGLKRGSEFQVNTYTTNSQGGPSAAMDTNGDFVVVWNSYQQDGSQTGVYGQRLIPPVNHAPSGTSGTVTAGQNVAYALKTSDFGFSDPNDVPPNSLQAVKFTLLPSVGTLKDNNVAVSVNQFVSAADIASGKLVFTPNTDVLGGPFFLCKFQVQDNGGMANGGVNLDPSAKVLYVKLVKPNHAPSGTSKTLTTGESVACPLKTSDFGFIDPDDSPPNSLLAVKFTVLPTVGTLKDNGVAVTANQFVTATDITNGKLVFTPNTNLLGGPFFLSKFQVQDNGGTANGGVNLDPNAKVLYVNLVHVNHAPVGTAKTVTTLEDTAYTVKATDFGLTDPDDSPANSLLSVKFTLLPTAGSLKDNGVALTSNQFVSIADINGGKLIFTPNANVNGSALFLAKFQVQDNGGTANGGINLDATARVLTIKITSVNDAPSGAANTVATSINTPYTFKTGDFHFSDLTDNPPNAFLAVKISTLPLVGALTDNGVTVTAGTRISVADITSGKLKFTPAMNGTGTVYASFTFQLQDNGGTANGGFDTDTTPRKMTISVI